MDRRPIASLILLLHGSAAVAGQDSGTPKATIPLCPGLTIVTAVNQSDGDYESIKTIESMTDADVRIKYSSERMVEDIFSSEPPKLQRLLLYRTVRREDLASAKLYLQQFSTELPEMIPETTAIGTSTAVLRAIKTRGEAEMGIFIVFSQNKPSLDRSVHPNVYDNQMIAKVVKASPNPVSVPVLVNDVRVELPAVHAVGDFFSDKSEFFFLDEEANPLAFGSGSASTHSRTGRPLSALAGKRFGRSRNAAGDQITYRARGRRGSCSRKLGVRSPANPAAVAPIPAGSSGAARA